VLLLAAVCDHAAPAAMSQVSSRNTRHSFMPSV
jgi:hypothetical protein